jgi:hypothetical protein
MEGVDLIEGIRRGDLDSMIAFSEDITYGYEEKCIQDERYKYIRGRDYGFLFDKLEDPGETFSILATHGAVEQRLGTLLDAVLAGPTAASGEVMKIDVQTLDRLRQLGYIE